MILINLLPHREAARKQKREFFFVMLGIAALLGGLICGGVYSWYQTQISSQKGKNLLLKSEITKLENQIKDIAGLQQEIAALRARQGAVEELQGNRNLPVYLLTELVKQLPVPLGRLPPFVLAGLGDAQLEIYDNGVCIGDLSLVDSGECLGLE